MNAVAPIAEASVPADLSPSSVSRDTFSQACARALNSPVIVTDIGDGALLVERKVVSKSHHHGGLNG